jgi:hypothetical protein
VNNVAIMNAEGIRALAHESRPSMIEEIKVQMKKEYKGNPIDRKNFMQYKKIVWLN